MHKELLYINDAAIVVDENSDKIVIKKCNNLEDILKQENINELLEDAIE